MREITFYPGKAKQLPGFLGSMLFTATGIWMVYEHDIFFGHLVYLFGGLTFVGSVIMMLTGASYLKLRDDEFEFGRVFRKHCVK
ncbi:MAG: hypothetical protein CNF01_01180 [Halieaceae bacterium MED-G27]|nr:MAG: hypothetical protein CNF01_01180 [Halieaceae bacterium MED-G27]